MKHICGFKALGSPQVDVAIAANDDQLIIAISHPFIHESGTPMQWKYGVYVDAEYDGGAWVWGVYDPDCGPVCGTCYEGHYGANLAISPAEFGDLLTSVLIHWGYEVDTDLRWEEQVMDYATGVEPDAFDAVMGLKVQQS